MTINQIRSWLGLYFLIATVAIAAYFLLLSETPALPLSESDATDCFQILVPVLLGQLTLMFKSFGQGQSGGGEQIVDLPVWVVKAPPALAILVIVLGIAALIVGNLGDGKIGSPSPKAFKGLVTFAVALLNGTTVFVISRFFKPAA